jgi:hypothetical protein
MDRQLLAKVEGELRQEILELADAYGRRITDLEQKVARLERILSQVELTMNRQAETERARRQADASGIPLPASADVPPAVRDA